MKATHPLFPIKLEYVPPIKDYSPLAAKAYSIPAGAHMLGLNSCHPCASAF